MRVGTRGKGYFVWLIDAFEMDEEEADREEERCKLYALFIKKNIFFSKVPCFLRLFQFCHYLLETINKWACYCKWAFSKFSSKLGPFCH